jgi:hypothetical protein
MRKLTPSTVVMQVAALALAAVSLTGCYVYPAEPRPVYYGPAYAVPVPGPSYGYWRHSWYDHRRPGRGHW